MICEFIFSTIGLVFNFIGVLIVYLNSPLNSY
jgi:hypothetical protein